MCFSKLFKKKSATLTIPYPEEASDPLQTVENTNVDGVILQWLRNYRVPLTEWDWWKTKIAIHIYNFWPDEILARYRSIHGDTPAFTVEENGQRNLYCLAPFLNPGVVAHEQSHTSYSLLTDAQKQGFSILYNQLKTTDPLIVLLYSKNTYGLTNDIEGHAEIMRYLGPDKMPERLKQYYIKLI